MYVYVCMCVYMYVYVYTCVSMCMCKCVCVCVCVCVHSHMCVYEHVDARSQCQMFMTFCLFVLHSALAGFVCQLDTNWSYHRERSLP